MIVKRRKIICSPINILISAISKIRTLNIKKAITIPLNHTQKALHRMTIGGEGVGWGRHMHGYATKDVDERQTTECRWWRRRSAADRRCSSCSTSPAWRVCACRTCICGAQRRADGSCWWAVCAAADRRRRSYAAPRSWQTGLSSLCRVQTAAYRQHTRDGTSHRRTQSNSTVK